MGTAPVPRAPTPLRALPRFLRFCSEVKHGAALDDFVFEIRGGRLPQVVFNGVCVWDQWFKEVLHVVFFGGAFCGASCMENVLVNYGELLL